MSERIELHIGDFSATAVLLDTETARAFARRLPLGLRVSGMGVDLCGRLPFTLPYESGAIHRGWSNGDINYNPNGGWLAISFGDEENSCRYGDQVTLGSIEGPLDGFFALQGCFELHVMRADSAGEGKRPGNSGAAVAEAAAAMSAGD